MRKSATSIPSTARANKRDRSGRGSAVGSAVGCGSFDFMKSAGGLAAVIEILRFQPRKPHDSRGKRAQLAGSSRRTRLSHNPCIIECAGKSHQPYRLIG
jgi:hypothetical protein